MNSRIFISLFFLITSFFCSSSLYAARSFSENPMEKVEAALKKREISRDEAVMYKVFSIFDEKRLPARFKSTGPVVSVKNGTVIMRELKKDFDTLSLQTQEILRPYLFKKKGRSIGKVLYKTAGTGSVPSAKTVLEGHLLANYTTTENFNIEWGPYNNFTTDYNGNSVPDVIDRWAEYLETSWTEIITNLGYAPPKDAYKYFVDVYIGNTDPEKTIDDIAEKWYGYVFVYSDFPGVPYLVVNKDYSWAPPNDDLVDGKDAGAMKVTAAHEFFHTVHLTIDYDEDGWWMEASSTWMEDHVYNGVNDYHNYIDTGSLWTQYPNVSLVLFNGAHEYGSVIWGKYLSENWGGALAVKSVWDNCTSVQGPTSVSATNTFFSGHTTTLSEAFKDFAVKNVFMDYSEGSNYGAMASRASFSEYTSDIKNSRDLPLIYKSPDYLGTNYLRFLPAGGTDLTIAFDGDEYYRGRDIEWGAAIVLPTLTGYSTVEIPLDSTAQTGFATISGYSAYTSLYLVATVLSPTGLTPSESPPTSYEAYPDGIPFAFHAFENTSTPVFPLMEFTDNDEVITIGKLNGSGGGGGGGCFIATAAYGYYDEPHVMLLRDFRDRFLLTNRPGRSFVDFYYRVSPDMADYISEREWLRSLVRIMLLPLIGFAWLSLKAPSILYFFTFIILAAVIFKVYSFKNRATKQLS